MLPEIPVDESIWRRIQSLQIRVSRVELLATLQSLMQAKNSQIARGFIACCGSELPPAQRRSLELIKRRSTIQSIESTESIQSIQSIESTQSTESTESIESTESTESIESIQSTESIQSIQSIQSTESIQSIQSTESIQSIQSTESTESIQSIQSNPHLSLSESIKACYQRVLRSNSPADRTELRSLIARLPSLDAIESILRDCVKKDAIASQLEAKQFVLALLDASRLDEAESLARLLKTDFNVDFSLHAAHS